MTKISSLGKWVPVYDEEWDGDVPLGLERPVCPPSPGDSERGVVTFKGDALPWTIGSYEVSTSLSAPPKGSDCITDPVPP